MLGSLDKYLFLCILRPVFAYTIQNSLLRKLLVGRIDGRIKRLVFAVLPAGVTGENRLPCSHAAVLVEGLLQLCYWLRFVSLVSPFLLVASVGAGIRTNVWFVWSAFHSCLELGGRTGSLECLCWVKSLLGGVKLLDILFGWKSDGLIGWAGGLES